jgi:hypothetical protein
MRVVRSGALSGVEPAGVDALTSNTCALTISARSARILEVVRNG